MNDAIIYILILVALGVSIYLLIKINFFKYLRSIIAMDSNDSSKRFLAIVAGCLVSFIVLKFTDKQNFKFVLGELLVFILGIFGASVYQSVRHKEIDSKKEL